MWRRCAPALGALWLLATATGSLAQTYAVLRFLDATDGFVRARLLVSGNTLYGTTSGPGEILKLGIDGTGFTRFQFPGFSSEGGLVESGPTLYGTVAGMDGAVFSVNKDGTGYTTLKAFYRTDGADPLSELLLVETTLYGTTYYGGPTNYQNSYGIGTVFKVNTNGTGFSSLWSFSGTNGLAHPRSALVVSGTSLFGTAGGGIFRINQDGTGFTVLRTLSRPLDGAAPGSLLLCGTTLYGACGYGGAFDRGTLFRLETDGTGFSVLKHFSGPEGWEPVGGLVQVDGTLYGVTSSGGYGYAPGNNTGGYGTIFQIETNGSDYYVLKEFAPPYGVTPLAGLAASGHTLYGSTLYGGISNRGTIFSFTLRQAPWFMAPPSDQVVAAGQNGSFRAGAAGARPLSYQWFFNGTNLVQGATGASLQFSPVSFSDAGLYAVVVTNLYGAATSPPARLRVILASSVTNCTEADLRAALAGGGVVGVNCDGTFPLSSPIEIAQDTTLDATGQTVVLSGSNLTRLFYVKTNATFTLGNLALADGRSTDGPGGGAIFSEGGTVNLLGVRLVSNRATNSPSNSTNLGSGGAILNQAGTLNATNCTFAGNAVQNRLPDYFSTNRLCPPSLGGAVCNLMGEANFENCFFTNNRVVGSTWGYVGTAVVAGCASRGGAIFSSGSLVMSHCSFMSNSTSGGTATPGTPGSGVVNPPVQGGDGGEADGGAVCSVGSLSIAECLLAANTAIGGIGGHGGNGSNGDFLTAWSSRGGPGGLSCGGGLFNQGSAGLVNCTFAGNLALGGPGGEGGTGGSWINLGSGEWNYTAGSAGGNGGNGNGGSILSTNGSANLTNCTIAFNSSSGGAGGAGGFGNPSASTGWVGIATSTCRVYGGVLVNNLLATNAPGNCSGSLIDAGHNLSSDTSFVFTGAGSLNNCDPLLGPLWNNRGPTLTMALLSGSPAIDAGDTASAPVTDQRGFPRPVGAAADIGAYEFGSPAYLQASRAAAQVNLLARGVPNQAVILQASANLETWVSIATNYFSPNGTWLLNDVGDSGQKFFRLQLP